ncbi:cadherin repeat domain-containing protein [Vibrio diazotrophicus]|uniref:Cadherin domain-containing protein n=1 Tax=Vibrio diazotrophicus TaxID=685 RepID=A0ABX4WER7_VIBDI|nr:cadherin repeat domain-containing protein [Vibrio diazotrophicus]PNI01400.1 hypothetical protein C1O25_07665 [Vibrio diazotrophicus]
MNARTLSQFMLANITLVIDRQGQIRELIAGAQPAPGEVVMTVSDDANPQVQAQLIQANDQQTPLNIDDEVAQILAQLEQGVDPTLNPDQATAAGGANGSSPTDTGTIDMTLAEVLAQTAFDTNGLQAPGLSQTQSLAIDLVIAQAVAPIAPVVNAAVLDVDEAPYFVDVPSDDPQDSSTDSNDDGKVDSYTFGYNENSTVDDLIGTVQAIDPEGGTVTYRIDPESEHAEYFSVTEEGKIYLTAAGVAAFTNDFEAGDDNQHNITVIASDGVNEVSIPVTLNELDVNEAPQFVDPEIDDDPNDVVVDENDDGVAESYSFSYNEKSSLNDVIGVVKAIDPEGTNVTYSIDPNSEEAAYFSINDDGEIYLTPAGIEAYTNDFEAGDDNQHRINVIASDGVNEVTIPVTLNELDVNEAPYFVDTSYTDETDESDDPNNYLPGNDFTEATEQSSAAYKFYYNENSEAGVTIGQVQANDVDNDSSSISYAITNNVMVTVDDVEYELFQINAETGEISLTAKGVELYTNDYEKSVNDHSIQVSATEVFPPSEEGGDVSYGYTVYTTVDLFERNVNEAPVGENFTLDVTDAEGVLFDFGDGKGEVKLVRVVFDNNLVPSEDHISDVDVDYLSTNPTLDDPYQDLIQSQELSVYITELPSIGSLYYWNEDQSTYVLIEESDLYVEGNDSPTMFDPDSIFYKAGEPGDFTIDKDTTGTQSEGGDVVYTLSNGALITVSATSDQGNGNKGIVTIETNNGSSNNNQGEGFGVDGGNGIGNGETLIFDLSANPLSSVSFGVDGLNSNHQATVVYTYLDGTKSEPMYYGDGSVSQSADVSYSAPDADNPIVQIEFIESAHTGGSESNSGSNYVVSYISGEEAVVNDPTFEYTVVDSEGAMPVDEDDNVVTYEVTLDVENGGNIVYADTGDDTLEGDDRSNIFTWLDSALDNSTDIIKNFEFGVDKVDLTSILDDDTETTDISDLLGKVTISSVDNEDVVLTVEHGASESQTIIIEDIYADIAGMEAADILNSLVKVNTETV